MIATARMLRVSDKAVRAVGLVPIVIVASQTAAAIATVSSARKQREHRHWAARRSMVIFLRTSFVLSIIAAGVASDLHTNLTGSKGPGEWHISAGPGPAVWKHQSGALYYCTRSRSCTLVADR